MKWLFGFIFLLFASCSNKFDNSNLRIFKYNESSDLRTLDPVFAKDQARVWVTSQIFNGLVQLNNNLEITPSIAKSWKISENRLTYMFNLRNDVYFHEHNLFKKNKRKVTANDFTYSFNRIIDNDVLSPGKWVLSNVSSFCAINDSVFKITLKKPFSAFLGLLTMQYCSVVPHEIVENSDFNKEPIGTGPFKFQIWKNGVKLVLRKNENYFEKSDSLNIPYIDAVSVSFIKDKQVAFLKFLKGEFDFISGIDNSYREEVLTNNGKLRKKYKNIINLQSLPYLNTEYLGFFMNDSTVLNFKLRSAINCGIDRRKMIMYLRNNIGLPAYSGFIPKGLPSFIDTIYPHYTFNPEKSKKLINRSGYKNQQITIYTTSSYLDLCEYIQHQLNEIGLNIRVEVNPPSTHREMVATSKLNFFRGSWIADYPDAENYFSLFYSGNFCPNGPNYTHFNDPIFDSLYVKCLSENNILEKHKIYNILNQIINDNSVVVPLYYDQVLRFTHKNIEDFNSNAMNTLNLKFVKKTNF